MRCISLWQPWAELVARELKVYETRSWPCQAFGPVAIHAAKRKFRDEDMTREARYQMLCDEVDPFDLKYGVILCVAEICGSVLKEAVGKVRQRSNGGLDTAIRREPLGLAAVEGEFQEGVSYHTTGWVPTCDCWSEDPVPCTVLDPFAGAGTTGLVALRYHRNFIGIELKAEYVSMARRRITGDAPLFNTREEVSQ